jgi:hypothetical protein
MLASTVKTEVVTRVQYEVGSSRDEDINMAAEGNKWSRVSCIIKETWAVRLPSFQGIQK